MKKKLILGTTVIIILLILLCNVVTAENYVVILDDMRTNLQNQLDDANEEMQQIEINLTKTLEELNNLNDKIAGYESDINSLEIDLLEIFNNIVDTEQRLIRVEEEYKRQKEIFEKRLVTLYEAGDTYYLDVLLNSSSLSDFLSNYFLISEIASYDTDLLGNIEREKLLIDNIKGTLEGRRAELKIIKDNREKTVIALENTKVIKNEYAKQLTEEELETQKKIDEFRTELDRIDTAIMMVSLQNLGTDYVGGVLAWPAPGYRTITSVFGMRIHPIFKIPRMHSGVDIGTPTGTPIVAANDGVVVRSEYTEGYGYVVMINHGGGVLTVYGHASELISKVGDEVKRGDVVMLAGSTGWSTGPHLHFEVRINGTCVDPLPYITTPSKTDEESREANE